MRRMLHQFDHHLTSVIQHLPDWVHPIMASATLIGQPIFTVGISAMVIGIGLGKANYRLFYAGLVMVATFYIGTLLKLFLKRDRPITDYVLHMRFDTFSFPSGHAVGGMIAYGMLAYLAWQLLPQPWNFIAIGFFVVLIILIGLSRIYLGAHYPSDVLAGWAFGIVGLAIIIFIIRPQL